MCVEAQVCHALHVKECALPSIYKTKEYVLASGAPSARTHPTLSEFSYIGQSRGGGKPLPRWRKRRLRRERDILHASDLHAFFSCCVALVLSTRLHAQSNLKRREGTYIEACISPPFFGARQNLRRRLPRGESHDRGTHVSVQSVAAAIEDAYAPPIGEVLPRNGRES